MFVRKIFVVFGELLQSMNGAFVREMESHRRAFEREKREAAVAINEIRVFAVVVRERDESLHSFLKKLESIRIEELRREITDFLLG